jgi:ubiquitin C-terminal hydrolase
MEDLSESAAAAVGSNLPLGLENLGNTCYMNACIQCVHKIPVINQALRRFRSLPGYAQTYRTEVQLAKSTFRREDEK